MHRRADPSVNSHTYPLSWSEPGFGTGGVGIWSGVAITSNSSLNVWFEIRPPPGWAPSLGHDRAVDVKIGSPVPPGPVWVAWRM